jgi:hypothetical protein
MSGDSSLPLAARRVMESRRGVFVALAFRFRMKQRALFSYKQNLLIAYGSVYLA